jgi:demethoxyubiquinone hydroxylase (CLK1/Coq7/Cat5 family)
MINAVDNESQHASNLKNRITELKYILTSLSFLFRIAGSTLGFLSKVSGKMLALKIDVLIEKRAVKDYSYFLRTLKLDDETKMLIKNIITDEELHIKNWQDSIKLLKNKP